MSFFAHVFLDEVDTCLHQTATIATAVYVKAALEALLREVVICILKLPR